MLPQLRRFLPLFCVCVGWCFSTFHPELVPGQSDCLLRVRRTTSYTIDPISFYSSGSISQSVCTHALAECWAHFPFILIIAWLFFIFCNAAPQAKGWPWIMGPVEPIGAMRRAPRFAFINWQHELNIGLLLSVSDFGPTSLCTTQNLGLFLFNLSKGCDCASFY
jgi:hypothetical protein